MAYDNSGLLRDIADHPVTIDTAFRARLAVQGRAVPLRKHEVLSMRLPGDIVKIERVEFEADGSVRVSDEHRIYDFAHPLRPPVVTEIAGKPSLLETTKDAWEDGDLVAGVRIFRDGQGERVNLPGHSTFAEIQRDTVRVVDGKLRYVAWTESFVGILSTRHREHPSLVVDGVATQIECDEFSRIIADGDVLYVLTVEVTQVREPTGGGLLARLDDGKRRDTIVRSLDGTVVVTAQYSNPDDWSFVARTGALVVLTGSRQIDRHDRCDTVALLRADGRGDVVDPRLVGNGRRLPSGVLVACELDDRTPGFAWFHDADVGGRDYKKFPLYGRLEDIVQLDDRTLIGWHAEMETLFVSRYSRD